MKNAVTWIIFSLVVLAIGAYMVTYTVRFTETAVRTTFGSADDNSVQAEPGLKIRAPYPFQSVTKYDKRTRVLQTSSSTQQMADDSNVIVEAFATWRVTDPLRFFQRFSNAGGTPEDHYEAAESILRTSLLSALGEVSKYRLTDLFTPERGASKLPELEQRILDVIRTGGNGGTATTAGAGLATYGVEVSFVGINRVVLPEDTTQDVIERMGADRDRLVTEIESQGTSRATTIRARAEADARKIRAFAERRAAEIRARGEAEAAEFFAQQRGNERLAVFLQQIEMMKSAEAKRFTLVLSIDNFGLNLFSPASLQGLAPGQIPGGLPSESSLLSGATARESVLRDAVGGRQGVDR